MDGGAWLASVHGVAKRHDWATSLSLFTFMHWRRKWQPSPVFLPGESQGQQSLVGCRHGVTQSRTRLKWLSSSSSIHRFWGFIRILSISFCSLYPVISAFVCVDSFLLLPLGLRHCLFKMGTCCLGFLSFVHSYFFFQLFFFLAAQHVES